jgi:hypothetical protein
MKKFNQTTTTNGKQSEAQNEEKFLISQKLLQKSWKLTTVMTN